MIGRSIIQSSRIALQSGRLAVNRYPIIQASRGVHKGIESVPPMRFMSVPVSFFFIYPSLFEFSRNVLDFTSSSLLRS